jgi:hypothetical protein
MQSLMQRGVEKLRDAVGRSEEKRRIHDGYTNRASSVSSFGLILFD